ncbi:hypothetical protein Vlu01_11960 [Micromonospora lutea]|uniref:Uncharacterized protein n=1 Tax=Micromonospora lutea TaxID=419825 RepID=A0ABQ4IRN6_9ACTN|nr:hypothetical protein Vlu01_11960 [Micromonospora lutea]
MPAGGTDRRHGHHRNLRHTPTATTSARSERGGGAARGNTTATHKHRAMTVYAQVRDACPLRVDGQAQVADSCVHLPGQAS